MCMCILVAVCILVCVFFVGGCNRDTRTCAEDILFVCSFSEQAWSSQTHMNTESLTLVLLPTIPQTTPGARKMQPLGPPIAQPLARDRLCSCCTVALVCFEVCPPNFVGEAPKKQQQWKD